MSKAASKAARAKQPVEQSSPWTSIVKSMDELLRYHHWKSDRRDVNESTVLRVVTRRPDTRLSLLSARPRILARYFIQSPTRARIDGRFATVWYGILQSQVLGSPDRSAT